jgi:hypothetical protein
MIVAITNLNEIPKMCSCVNIIHNCTQTQRCNYFHYDDNIKKHICLITGNAITTTDIENTPRPPWCMLRKLPIINI